MANSGVAIEDLGRHVDQEVAIHGWLYNRRGSGKLHFLEVRDGTGIVQAVVFKGDASPELFERAGRLAQETSLVVRGTVREHPKRKGEYELSVRELSVVSEPTGEYPITPK